MGGRKGIMGVGKRWSKTAQASSFRVGRKPMDSIYKWKKKSYQETALAAHYLELQET